MNYYHVELTPAPNRFFDEDDVPLEGAAKPGSMEATLDAAWAERAASYEKELAAGYQAIRWGAGSRPRYPSHEVSLPGDVFTIVYDGALNRRLRELYALHGRQGILTVEETLDRVVRRSERRPLHPWSAVRALFAFARNSLLLLIREALIEIDLKSSAAVASRLSLSARMVAKEWANLKVTSTEVETNKDVIFRHTPVYGVRYSLGNRAVGDRLFTALGRVVAARDDIAAQEAKRQKHQRTLDYFASEGVSPPHGAPLDLEAVVTWLREVSEGTTLLTQDVCDICPLAPLAVPLLKRGFTRAEMEDTLGVVLSAFYRELDRLGEGFKSHASWVAVAIPGRLAGQPIETVFPPDSFLETDVIELATRRAVESPEHLSMLAEAVLDGLFDDGSIERDSFTYVVHAHYRNQLMARLAVEAENQSRLEDLIALLSKAAALMSLALWVTPAGRVAKGISVGLDLSVLVVQTYSVLHQLSQLDLAIAKSLIALDRHGAETIAHIAELGTMRREYVDSLTTTLAVEIATIGAAGAWAEFKMLMHLRGYYDDLQTLIGE